MRDGSVSDQELGDLMARCAEGAGDVSPPTREILENLRVGGEEIHALVSTSTITSPLLTALSVGFLFGVYPAIRAARIDPIEALRRE